METAKTTSSTEQFRPNPFDGFRASVIQAVGGWKVMVELMSGGEPVESELASDVLCRAKADRLQLLLDGLCRYLTAGGGPDEIRDAMRRLGPMLSQFRIEFPPSWELICCGMTDLGFMQMIICSFQERRAWTIVCDTFAEELSIEDLANEL